MKATCLFLFFSVSVLSAQFKIHEGIIDGAKYKIMAADKPSGKVLLLAHGMRNKQAPLSADFDITGFMARSLIADGWTIASTSYRRNGWIIEDAIADLASLQAKVSAIQGEPKTTYILGNSMGAQIAILAAEGALQVDGAITTGAALQAYPKNVITKKIAYSPQVPVILLINQEVNRPMSVHYYKKAGAKKCALWKIERLGHCNVSDAEKVAAVRALDQWRAGDGIVSEKDATIPTPIQPSTATLALIGKANKISESWGNITTSFVKTDLDKLGVKLKDKLLVTGGSEVQTVTLLRHYSESKRGQAIAYINSEGFLKIMVFGERMSEKLGVKAGDKMTISVKEP